MLLKEPEYKGTSIEKIKQRYLDNLRILFNKNVEQIRNDANYNGLEKKRNAAYTREDNYKNKYNTWEHRIARMMGIDKTYKKLSDDSFYRSSAVQRSRHFSPYNDDNWRRANRIVREYHEQYKGKDPKLSAFFDECKQHYHKLKSKEALDNWIKTKESSAMAFAIEVYRPRIAAEEARKASEAVSNEASSKNTPQIETLHENSNNQEDRTAQVEELYTILNNEETPTNNPRYSEIIEKIASLSSQDRALFIKNVLTRAGNVDNAFISKYNQFYNGLSQQLSHNLHYKSAEAQDVELVAERCKMNSNWEESKLHMHRFTVEFRKNKSAAYKNMMGDMLKTAILSDFKLALKNKSENEIQAYVDQYKKSDEYKVLKTNQDWSGLVGSVFGHKTTSIKAFNNIVEEMIDKARLNAEDNTVSGNIELGGGKNSNRA